MPRLADAIVSRLLEALLAWLCHLYSNSPSRDATGGR